MKRKVFNPAQLAAMVSAGVVVAPVAAPAAAAPAVEPVAAAAAPLTPTVTTAVAAIATPETEAARVAAAAAAPAVEPAPAAAPTVQADAAVVTFLQGQVRDKDAQILALTLQVNSLEAAATETAAALPALVEIVGRSASQMSVALGGAALNTEGMNVTALLAEHKRLADTFSTQFKAGGVAAIDATEEPEAAASAVDSEYQARLNAARPQSAKKQG